MPVRRIEENTNLSGLILCALIVCALSAHAAARGQTPSPHGGAYITGHIKDAGGRPVPEAEVFLNGNNQKTPLTFSTGAQGDYRFAGIAGGTYSLRVEAEHYQSSAVGPFVLKPTEGRRVDIKLEPRAASSPAAAAKLPGFFDQPQFMVAGVTTPANPGGHGSDETLRTTQALTRAIVALAPDSDHVSAPPFAAEQKLRLSLRQNPSSFDANFQLGKLLLAENKAREALPYLEKASQMKPNNYESAYELAQGYEDAGDQTRALARANSILAFEDKADVHRLLAEIEEKSGDPIAAVQQYQRAAELDPSEANLFAWGTELLLHDTVEPATEVFTQGNRLFPNSVRMLVALGVTWYSRGSYDQAVQRLCQASDLDPADPNAYMFLSRIQSASAVSNPEIVEKLGRFWRLRPDNALANYYYAAALWQANRQEQKSGIAAQAESLLKKAIALNPNLGPAYLQLGIVDAQRNDFAAAVEHYRKAIALDPSLAEAHYHLSQAYMRAGNAELARQEGQVYQQMSQRKGEEAEREQQAVRQFVYKSQEK